MPEYEWPYSFANTIFGPINRDLTSELEELYAKGLLELFDRKIVANRVEEKYCISKQGIQIVNDTIILPISIVNNVAKISAGNFAYILSNSGVDSMIQILF